MTCAPLLAPGVHFCVAQGHGIFLDLKRDAYSAVTLPGGDVAAQGLEDADPALAGALIAAHHELLLEAGLITRDLKHGARLTAALCIPRPTAQLHDHCDRRAFGGPGYPASDVEVGWTDWVDFLLAAHRASLRLRTKPIFDIVEAVRRRKSNCSERSANLEAFRRQTMIFAWLRPWYPRDYLCLFDALALLEFLARRGLYPTWVFGVQAQPFGAHCWVQSNERLLNEGAEYANQFTPIMAV